MTDTDKKRVIGLDGGPRKGWNTATLLDEALAGAREAGAETSVFRLFDLVFKGCASCFSCKRKDHYLDGVCALKDGLSPVLEAARGAAGIVMASPVYISDVTACLRAFLERYVFINLSYDNDHPAVLEKAPAVLVIYTTGAPADRFPLVGYDVLFRQHRNFLERINSASVEQLVSSDTYQFTDYSKYHAPAFDVTHKQKIREEVFPADREKARAAGARLIRS
jgi:multimeric flavodoxin WrbA